MRTLAQWENRLLQVPNKFECPVMTLHSSNADGEPLFVGPGYIEISSNTSMTYTVFATPIDFDRAFICLRKAQEDPYDESGHLRLTALDYQGVLWNCGTILPRLKDAPATGWPLTGEVHSLSTIAKGPWVSGEPGVELIFNPAPRLPMSEAMEAVTTVGGELLLTRRQAGHQNINALETTIRFGYSPENDSLQAMALSSKIFQAPYAENWIAEPLRIMLGQMIYPRLVARNLGDGSSIIWVRPAPTSRKTVSIAALMDADHYRTPDEFWGLYTQILQLIATSVDEKGIPNFEPHPLTRYFEEIIQASQGSRWVWCLTLASVSEGLGKKLMKSSGPLDEFKSDDIQNLLVHVKTWAGDPKLQQRIVSEINRIGQKSVSGYFQMLVNQGILTRENKKAWASIRNSVMHGNLVSPWSTDQEDRQIIAIADLVHRLARELVSRATLHSK